MNIKGGTHLDLSDRIRIETELDKKTSLKDIAALVYADPKTISKEIKKRRIMTSNHRIPRFAGRTKSDTCKSVLRFPYVCNGCHERKKCNNAHFFDYRAKEAQANYEKILKEIRQGIDMDPMTLDKVDDIVTKGLKDGQSISHIYYANESEIPCSINTLYRHIGDGYMTSKKIDLKRAVKFKKRAKKITKEKKDKTIYEGRRYEDFIVFISQNVFNTFIAQLDTFLDPRNGAGKSILTIHFTASHFMIMRLLERKNKEEVSKQFVYLRELLSDGLYAKMFHVGLTDRGSEFCDIAAYEIPKDDGSTLCKLFFCDSYSSYQKGACEENHTLLRYVLPKKRYFDDLTQDKLDIIASHINSYYRESIKCVPYDLFIAQFSKETADKLHIQKIDPKKVKLNEWLIK